MVFKQEKFTRLHGLVYAAAIISITILAVFLLHTQTDVWQQIQRFTANRYGSRNISSTETYNLSVKRENSAQNVQTSDQSTSPPPLAKDLRHQFTLVKGVSSRLYVYGVLWNVQNVRLISIMVQGYNFPHLWCVLYYTEDKNDQGVRVRPEVIELHTGKSPYTGASIKCPLKPGEYVGEVPSFVGLVESELAAPNQTFPVENIDEKAGIKREFTVCVPAMFDMKNAALLVQKIEMVRLFGAGRIVLYNASISLDVDAVLRMYAKEWAEGREDLEVVVMPWKLPIENKTTIGIPYYAQQLAINDCMYRYKRLSEYMAFSDLDEYMVPFKHENWSTLVTERRRLKPKTIGWLFRCSVLNDDIPSPAQGYEDDYMRYGSAIFGLTSRDQYVFPANDRAKLIVDPTTIEEMGVHLIWGGGGLTDNLPVNVGMLFHYREPLSKCTAQVTETRMVDKFGKRLAARLKEIWSKMSGVELGWTPFKTADRSGCKES